MRQRVLRHVVVAVVTGQGECWVDIIAMETTHCIQTGIARVSTTPSAMATTIAVDAEITVGAVKSSHDVVIAGVVVVCRWNRKSRK